jgi:hypothetical protein
VLLSNFEGVQKKSEEMGFFKRFWKRVAICITRLVRGIGKLKKIPVGARFFAHVQTGPGAHPASCTMGTGSFLEVKRPGRDDSSAEVTKGYSYTSIHPLGQFRPVTGQLYLCFYPLIQQNVRSDSQKRLNYTDIMKFWSTMLVLMHWGNYLYRE